MLGKVKTKVQVSEVVFKGREDKLKGKALDTPAETRRKVATAVPTEELNIMVSFHCLVQERELRSHLSCPQRKSEVNIKN